MNEFVFSRWSRDGKIGMAEFNCIGDDLALGGHVLVALGLATACCTCVMLTDAVAMSPTIISRERFVGRPR